VGNGPDLENGCVARYLNRADEVFAMPTVHESWIGQAVVLQVASGDLCLPLRGVIISESNNAIRFRIGKDWDVDIYKRAILAVEQDSRCFKIVN
jgi:hypothetical protein